MKIYVIDVRYYIPANDVAELNKVLDDMEVKNSEYYGGYEITDVEENANEDLQSI